MRRRDRKEEICDMPFVTCPHCGARYQKAMPKCAACGEPFVLIYSEGVATRRGDGTLRRCRQLLVGQSCRCEFDEIRMAEARKLR